jgi:hypothetical protein
MTSPLIRIGAAALLASLAGCASNTPRLDGQFGVNTKATLQQQILHPQAPASQAVAGVDGQAAKSAYDNYQKSFKDPVPQTGALSIGVGK